MTQFAGIDIGRNHTYSCVLDIEQGMFHYPDHQMNLNETVDWLDRFWKNKLKGGCIDGPPNLNNGTLGQQLPEDTNHNTNRRLTEFQIGISGCYATPAVPPQPGAHNDWMLSAFNMFGLLSNRFGWNIEKGLDRSQERNHGQLIETHPTYAFKALLGCNHTNVDGIQRLRLDPQAKLRRKSTQEGWQQRIELLTRLCNETGLEVGDLLLQKWNQRIDWVDAAICAFMSYWQQTRPEELISPGTPKEGAIYLRIPPQPFDVTRHDIAPREARMHRAVGGHAQAVNPSHPMDGVETPANAIILRLGDTPNLSQLDTIDTIRSSEDQETFWFPCGSNAMPQLCRNLELVGGRLFLSWGSNLCVALNVDECVQGDDPLPYPVDAENPWPFTECRRWLRIRESKEINTDQFYVNQNRVWTQGFGGGQTALLWAVVPVIEGPN